MLLLLGNHEVSSFRAISGFDEYAHCSTEYGNKMPCEQFRFIPNFAFKTSRSGAMIPAGKSHACQIPQQKLYAHTRAFSLAIGTRNCARVRRLTWDSHTQNKRAYGLRWQREDWRYWSRECRESWEGRPGRIVNKEYTGNVAPPKYLNENRP